jgi:hypothetical protein
MHLHRRNKRQPKPAPQPEKNNLEWMAWLVELIQREDLETLSRDETALINGQIYSFCLESLGSMRRSGSLGAVSSGRTSPVQESPRPSFSPTRLARLAGEMRDGIGWWMERPPGELQARKLTVKLQWVRTPISSGRFVLQPLGKLEPCFWWSVYGLLDAEGRRLRRCARRAKCGRIFVKRKRGLYCSRRCSQTARTERWRAHRFKSDEDFRAYRHDLYDESRIRKNPEMVGYLKKQRERDQDARSHSETR